MDIQRLRNGDWERLRRLRLAALADAPEFFGSTLAEAERLTEADWRAQLDRLATFVAVEAGTDVGMARGMADDASRDDAAYLISMWVAPEARRRGVGAALIDAIVAWATGAGYTLLLLDVADDNAPAKALYERAGFTATGVIGALPPPRGHLREHQRALRLRARPGGDRPGTSRAE